MVEETPDIPGSDAVHNTRASESPIHPHRDAPLSGVSIPSRVHFCWIGPRIPWAYVFAVLSAAARGELSEVILHHTDALEDCDETTALSTAPGVTLHRIDAVACLAEAGSELGIGDQLVLLYGRIASPVMRSDILRAAILFLQGGIYLDMDTVTVASLRPLMEATQFVGCEYIVWPHAVRRSRSPVIWAYSLILDVMRKAMRRMAGGWRYFRRVENLYYRSVNNAVMGSVPGAPLFARYLRAMVAVPPDRLAEPYALGPDLLQELLARETCENLVIHGPQVFYPLSPEISEHWFRTGNVLRLNAIVTAETRVVHWYASVRTKSRVAAVTPGYVIEHRHCQLYSALVCASISTLPAKFDSAIELVVPV